MQLEHTRAFQVNVYLYKDGSCALDGASVKNSFLYVLHEKGDCDAQQIAERSPALLFKLEKRGLNYWAVRPVFCDEEKGPIMDGGNIATPSHYSSGKRAQDNLPAVMHIHDRQESWELYERMSRD